MIYLNGKFLGKNAPEILNWITLDAITRLPEAEEVKKKKKKKK